MIGIGREYLIGVCEHSILRGDQHCINSLFVFLYERPRLNNYISWLRLQPCESIEDIEYFSRVVPAEVGARVGLTRFRHLALQLRVERLDGSNYRERASSVYRGKTGAIR